MKEFATITPTHIAYFANWLPEHRLHQEGALLQKAASDETEDLKFLPELVLQPETTEEVSKIMAYCYQEGIPVTPRGAGTGLSGGALPVLGGICLDMQRMNKILTIDEDNFQVLTEPGVITEVLQNAVQEKGLFYPVDPASKGSCFIGGNVAENSGGPRAVKYGVVKDYVLNLEVVLPDGSVMWTGANTLKNATGYSLTQLIVGSEGTLAVITKIVLKLIPLPTHQLLLLAPFKSAHDACTAVNKIMLAGYVPSALEFMERDALSLAMDFLQLPQNLPADIEAHLLIEVDGNHPEELFRDMEGISKVLEAFDTGSLLFAESHEQKQELWRLRRVVSEGVKGSSVYKEEDTVVPRAKLPQLLAYVKQLGNKYGFRSVCYGHAGDGNLHVNILKGEQSDRQWTEELPKAIRDLFTFVHQLGGTISGEHGIGWVQKDYLDIVFSERQLELMHQIKNTFDPKGILNPGKIV